MLRIFYIVVFLISMDSASKHCDRRRSRLVSKVVNEKLMPAFKALNTELSSECLFSSSRSIYDVQETHKSSEDNRWYCHFCGKPFYTEEFLDLHFNNRHTDQLQEENSVCLGDVCEVFRCDVIGGDITPDFWDYALCLEDDMKTLYHRCSTIVDFCMPSGLTENETRWLTDITMQELCSYLTCGKYWEIPFTSVVHDFGMELEDKENTRPVWRPNKATNEETVKAVEDAPDVTGTRGLYIVLTVLIVFGLLVYYCLFCAYYYTDAFVDSVVYDPSPRTKHSIKPYQADMRQRTARQVQQHSTHS